MEVENQKIGEELYWRFAKFEELLKGNLLKVLYMISPSFLDLTNSGVPMDWYQDAWDSYVEYCNDFDIPIASEDFAEYFPDKPAGILRECEVHEDVRTKNTISHEERVAKLSLGFFVKLIKWENVGNICYAVQRNVKTAYFQDTVFLDIVFPKWTFAIAYEARRNDMLYTDLTKIKDLRNDFAHFRFDIAKLEETKKLLDEYIFLMEKTENTERI
jgi:hypothetical protein